MATKPTGKEREGHTQTPEGGADDSSYAASIWPVSWRVTMVVESDDIYINNMSLLQNYLSVK